MAAPRRRSLAAYQGSNVGTGRMPLGSGRGNKLGVGVGNGSGVGDGVGSGSRLGTGIGVGSGSSVGDGVGVEALAGVGGGFGVDAVPPPSPVSSRAASCRICSESGAGRALIP